MKNINLVLLIIFITSVTFQNKNNDCNICGEWKWEKNDEKHDFTLQIFQKDSFIYGRHCYILDYGNKMDCYLRNDDYSFKIKFSDIKSDSFSIKIKSYYSKNYGIVNLKLKDKKIYWNLLIIPKGEFYLPTEAILVKR
jgi:hypothetical protein